MTSLCKKNRHLLSPFLFFISIMFFTSNVFADFRYPIQLIGGTHLFASDPTGGSSGILSCGSEYMGNSPGGTYTYYNNYLYYGDIGYTNNGRFGCNGVIRYMNENPEDRFELVIDGARTARIEFAAPTQPLHRREKTPPKSSAR